jgi:hypothetical protein
MTVFATWSWRCLKCGASGTGYHDEEEAMWAEGRHECEKEKSNA